MPKAKIVGAKSKRKSDFFAKLLSFCERFNKILIVEADNVGSSHMQKIRKSLRPSGAEILMGKNTMMRKAIRGHLAKNPKMEVILPHLKGNIGFVFTNGSLIDIKNLVQNNRVMAPAKAGTVAPCDVTVPKGPTGMEPTMTSFLQALNISSKINKGQVEIVNDVHLIKAGEKVGSSEATLLSKLNIQPFSYGLKLRIVYDDGFMYKPSVLELTDDDLLEKFQLGVSIISSLSLAIGYPTMASVPHSLANAYKDLLSIAVETTYSWPEADKVKKILENPEAYAMAMASSSASSSSSASATKPEEKAPVEEVKEEEEEEDFAGGIDLFGGAEEDY